MIKQKDKIKIIFCSGAQSSGTSLISWCFLQHPEVDGYLDYQYDQLPRSFEKVCKKIIWYKQTDACFRASETQTFLEGEGFYVSPMLVVRDVRFVFSSLMTKWYGINGTTAEDPPLRIRLMRFKNDWHTAINRNWPILKWESFLTKPVIELKKACIELKLPYNESMVKWPKQLTDISYPGGGNQTFHKFMGTDLLSSVNPSYSKSNTINIPDKDLQWIEKEFYNYNKFYGYPEHFDNDNILKNNKNRLCPTFKKTRRFLNASTKSRLIAFFDNFSLTRKLWFFWNVQRILKK